MSASEVYAPADDDSSFSEVYRFHYAKLLRYCQYRLRDRHEAEDVAQEAFARAWRSMPTSAFDRNFYPWLKVVASNLCTDVLRKRNRSEPVAVIDIGSIDGEMDRIAEESDRILVRQALDRLNDRHRTALMMREDEGLTYDQIAARTGVTPGTVESLLWRARQALRREFTVLAGREGCLAAIPFLLALAATRVRASARRAMARLAGWQSAASEVPAAHIAVAAIAAITVAGGVVASMGLGGGGSGSGPAVVLQGGSSPVSRVTAAPVPLRAASTAAASVSPDAWRAGLSAASHTSGGAGTSAPASPTTAPFRVINPVPAVGAQANHQAYTAPLAPGVPGVVAVGVWPQSMVNYVTDTVSRTGVTVPTGPKLPPSTKP